MKKSVLSLSILFLISVFSVSAIPFFTGGIWDNVLNGNVVHDPVSCTQHNECAQRPMRDGIPDFCNKQTGMCEHPECKSKEICIAKFGDPYSDQHWICTPYGTWIPVAGEPEAASCDKKETLTEKNSPFPENREPFMQKETFMETVFSLFRKKPAQAQRAAPYPRGEQPVKKTQQDKTSRNPSDRAYANSMSMTLSAGRCQGKGPVLFSYSPLALDDLKYIIPMGKMYDAHVTPVDHPYWIPQASTGGSGAHPDHYRITVPADGFIVSLEHHTEALVEKRDGKLPSEDDYHIVIEHSCTFYSFYSHIDRLSEKILAQAAFKNNGPHFEQSFTRIPVKAGDVLGTVGDHSFDVSAANSDLTLPGFIVPAHYEREPWKIHTIDIFDAFTEPLQSQLIAKSVRAVKPYGGKIDYDTDGKLSGNWFLENTNGYQGIDRERYWSGHLVFAYNQIDPAHIIISHGNFLGRSTQFGVKGNAPDPAAVGTENGLIKYELVPYDYFVSGTNTVWPQSALAKPLDVRNDESKIAGVLLVQMIDKRKIKVDVFPGKTAADVQDFSANAQVYER